VNVNAPLVAFNGFVEFSNLNQGLGHGGSGVVYVPFYWPADDPRARWSDEELVTATFGRLARDWCRGSIVRR